MRVVLLWLLGVTGCPRSNTETPEGVARALLRARCGACHEPAQGTAKPGALAVFDLSREDWWKSMTSRQLDESVVRFEQHVTLTDAELEEFSRGGGVVTRATAEEATRYRVAVTAMRRHE